MFFFNSFQSSMDYAVKLHKYDEKRVRLILKIDTVSCNIVNNNSFVIRRCTKWGRCLYFCCSYWVKLLCRRWLGLLLELSGLFDSHQLLCPECLIVDHGSCFDQILKMSSSQKVTKMNEFTMLRILNINGSPACLSTAHSLSINNNVAFGTNNGKWNWFPDTLVQFSFLIFILFTLIRI